MIVLQVSMREMNNAQVAQLNRRFHRFFSAREATVEYPVTHESHAFDVFEDEFGHGTIHEDRVYGAWMIETHMDHDDFEPFSEEHGGDVLLEWTPELGWNIMPATD